MALDNNNYALWKFAYKPTALITAVFCLATNLSVHAQQTTAVNAELEAKSSSAANSISVSDTSSNPNSNSDEQLSSEDLTLQTSRIDRSQAGPNSEYEKEQKHCTLDAIYGERNESEEWIDGMRRSTHSGLCRTVYWIDHLFGDEHEFDDDGFSGKVSVGFREDTKDGLDPRLRVRIKTKLPNVSDRFNAFFGRVEEDSYISNTEVKNDRVTAVGLRSTDDDDSEWLIGIGYRNPNARANGFDYSVGAKISSGLNPYAKVTHRHLFPVSQAHYWRTEQTVFWRRDDGFGVSSNLDYTQLLSDRDILEWDTSVKYTEEQEQWEWITSTAWHHSFSKKRGVSTRAYVRGEEKNPVSIPEYGITFTYIRPFLRDWLFLETGIDFRWEKETLLDDYETEIRVGFQFEMLLGDYYSRVRDSYSKR